MSNETIAIIIDYLLANYTVEENLEIYNKINNIIRSK